MGCADDGCAVEYIKAHARLNAACDAAPYGDAAASDVDAASPDDAAPLDDDNAARSEPGAAALDDDDAARNLLPNLHDALHGPGGLCRVGAVGHASLHDLKVEGASYALYALEAALGAAQLFAASMDAPASPLRETLLWIWATHAFSGAEKAGLGREAWVRTGGALRAALSMPVYAAPLGARAARAMPPRLGGVLTRGAVLFELGLGPLLLVRRRAVGAALVLFHGVNLWTLAIFEFPLVALRERAAPARTAAAAARRKWTPRRPRPASLAALLVYANARALCASCNATLKSSSHGAGPAVVHRRRPAGHALVRARRVADVAAVCDDAGVPAVDCDATLKPHVLAALRDLARPASVSRVDLCKPDDTVGDVEAFVAASVSVAKITTLDCATDELTTQDLDLPRPVPM
ncbi:hypothetical protein JL722_5255 [Aureococcus anophagefferens]|nr:hypothetical protein JL722_5255 [Aureococcus anophagefferens]